MGKNWETISFELCAAFPVDSVKWRVGRVSKDGDRGTALAYIDARDVMDRLDLVVGVNNWKDSIHDLGNAALCTIEIWDDEANHWVSKTDGADESNIEATKGKYSDAFKRAAVKFGIGRYLYTLESPWVELEFRGGRKDLSKDAVKSLRSYLQDHMEKDSASYSSSLDEASKIFEPSISKSSLKPAFVENARREIHGRSNEPDPTSQETQSKVGNPMSEAQAKMLMAHCRTVGEQNGGAHGFEVLNWTLNILMLDPVRQHGARAPVYMDALMNQLGKSDVDTFKEEAKKFTKDS